MTHRAGSRVGRFVLLEVLGRGAQATVWRASDERLDREVALKLLAPGAQSIAVNQWMHEARAVSRLSHPHIVPVFEADDVDGQPYLVFELVQGHTLAHALRQSGAMPARAAVALLRGVLEALRAAHAQGIVHRDLKPSNILLGADGRPRVMDFGIAARVSDGVGDICGTPGYMSPEAAQGRAPTPAMDVYAAGMILGELLTGQALLAERYPQRALQRTIAEDVIVPDGVAIDAGLRAIVLRAVARDPTLRYEGVAPLADALDGWGGAAQTSDAPAASSNGTLDFLLRRMRHKSDFPALSDAVARIQRVAASDNESLNSLAAEILKDVALTHKLLRLVNSAAFRHAGGGTISTVSRAIALVGFAGVRNMALSLVLLDHMHDKQHAAQLKEQFLCALMAAQLASELSPQAREAEEQYLGALLHNLGRLLTEFYLPEEARAIRDELRPHAARIGDVRISAEQASHRVLGLGFEQLGIGVARAWGLPESLQQCMRPPDGPPPTRRLESAAERSRWLARGCNEIAEAVLRRDDAAPARLESLAASYAVALGHGTKDVLQAVQTARSKLRGVAEAIGLELPDEAPPAITESTVVVVGSEAITGAVDGPTLVDDATVVVERPMSLPPTPPASEVLTAGIQDITHTLAQESFRLNEVLRMILETMYRALGFRCVVFALKDAKGSMLIGRFGLGDGAQAMASQFSVSLVQAGGAQDLLAAVCRKGVDTLIADAAAANVASRLPPWLRRTREARTFLLLPMMMKGATFGLIYADRAEAGSIGAGEKELSLLRTLRNQAVMAFRQAT